MQNFTSDIGRELGIPANTPGVVISSADPSSAASDAGPERGDVIREVNRKPVRDVQEYHRALAASHNQSVLLLVSRGDTARFVAIEPR